MKKIIALLLAALMLLAGCALAEEMGAVLTVDHLTLEAQGQTRTVEGLKASLALQNFDNLPAVALLIEGGGEPLMTAVGQLTSQSFNLALGGMDNGYTAALPEQQAQTLAQLGDEGLSNLVTLLLPLLDQAALPQLGPVEIPALDVASLLSDFATGEGAFEIGWEQLSDLLDQALNLAREHQARNIEGLNAAIGALESLKRSGTGVCVRGTIEGAGSKAVGDLYLVKNGVTEEKPAARATLQTRPNNASLDVSLMQFGIPISLASFKLVSEPAVPRMRIDLSIIGTASMNLELYRQDALTRLDYSVKAGKMGGRMGFAYGQQGGSDLLSFDADIENLNLAFAITTAMGADGVRTGDAVLDIRSGGQSSRLSCDLTMYKGKALDLAGFAMPEDLRPIEELNDSVFQAAFEPVNAYVQSRLAVAPAA